MRICSHISETLSVFKSEIMHIRWPVWCCIANREDKYFENDFILQYIWASWDINYLRKNILHLIWKRQYRSWWGVLIQHYVKKFVSDLRQQYNWPPPYNWNVVESCVKHHKTNHAEFAAYIILTNSVNATNLIILRISMALSTV